MYSFKEKLKKNLINPEISPDKFGDLLIIQCIKISIFIVIPIALFIVFLFITFGLLNKQIVLDVSRITSLKDLIIFFSIPVTFFLGVLPLLYKTLVEKESLSNLGLICGRNKFYIFSMLISFVILFCSVLDAYYSKLNLFYALVLHNFAVALAEEILVRGIIFAELKKIFNLYSSIVIDALIFAFVFHANDDIKINLLVRFPLGLFLALIATRSKSIHPCILFHWSYNIIIALI